MSWMTDNADLLRENAQVRRNRGLSTGKSAKGWNDKRPDPTDDLELLRARAKARLRDHWADVLADYQWHAQGCPEIPF